METNTPESQTITQTPAEVLPKQPEKRKSLLVEDTEHDIIYIDDENWVAVPMRVSYELAEKFQEFGESEEKGKIAKLLIQVIKSWNIVEADGITVAPIDTVTINRLEVRHLIKIMNVVNEKVVASVEVPKAAPAISAGQ